MLGFRFPSYAEGIEVAGYHLHFIDEDARARRPRPRLALRRAAGPPRPLRRPPRRAAAAGRASPTPTSRPRPTRRGRAGRGRLAVRRQVSSAKRSSALNVVRHRADTLTEATLGDEPVTSNEVRLPRPGRGVATRVTRYREDYSVILTRTSSAARGARRAFGEASRLIASHRARSEYVPSRGPPRGRSRTRPPEAPLRLDGRAPLGRAYRARPIRSPNRPIGCMPAVTRARLSCPTHPVWSEGGEEVEPPW